MDAKSANLIEHVQMNKPADQVSLHCFVSRGPFLESPDN